MPSELPTAKQTAVVVVSVVKEHQQGELFPEANHGLVEIEVAAAVYVKAVKHRLVDGGALEETFPERVTAERLRSVQGGLVEQFLAVLHLRCVFYYEPL